MKDIMKRDITGKCVGECRDRVAEGERERQREINAMNYQSPESFPSNNSSYSRNEPPGFLGGHV